MLNASFGVFLSLFNEFEFWQPCIPFLNLNVSPLMPACHPVSVVVGAMDSGDGGWCQDMLFEEQSFLYVLIHAVVKSFMLKMLNVSPTGMIVMKRMLSQPSWEMIIWDYLHSSVK